MGTYMTFLDNTYQIILQEIQVPSFADPGPSIIDRQTYLPRFEWRRFDELESQGYGQYCPCLSTSVNLYSF